MVFKYITNLSDDVNWLVISRVEIFPSSMSKSCFQVQTEIIISVVLQTDSNITTNNFIYPDNLITMERGIDLLK